jgi:hypothetical protein
LAASRFASAQSGHTTVVVGTGDGATGQFLRGVQVHLTPLELTQYTDSMGQTRLPRVPPGRYTVEARRLGYQPLSAPILVSGEDSVEVVLLMNAAVAQLDPVVVSRSAVPMPLREFESRRERGLGQFLTGAQIDSMPGASLQSVIEGHIRGVTVVGDNVNGMHVMSYRQSTEHALSSVAGACWPTVYLDGVQLIGDTGNGPNLDIVALSSIGGIEYYSPSEVPVQYKASGTMQTPQHSSPRASGRGAAGMSSSGGGSTSPSCGVMLIWTKP